MMLNLELSIAGIPQILWIVIFLTGPARIHAIHLYIFCVSGFDLFLMAYFWFPGKTPEL